MLLGYLKRMAEKADRDYNDLSAAEIEQLVGTTPHAAAIDEPWTADFGLKDVHRLRAAHVVDDDDDDDIRSITDKESF